MTLSLRAVLAPTLIAAALFLPVPSVAREHASQPASREDHVEQIVAGLNHPVRAMLAERPPYCVTWNDMTIVFHPDATADVVRAALDSLPEYKPNYRHAQRWFSTAYTPTVEQFRPFTLTYSFAPDGTSAPDYSSPQVYGPSTLFASMDAAFPSQATWMDAFRSAIETIGSYGPINYIEVSDDSASYGNPGVVGQRGDVRIAMRYLDGAGGVLAFNYYPGVGIGGDMVLDSGDVNYYANSSQSYRRLRNTVSHEHGHGLGLAHVLPANSTKIMEPYITTAFDGPQEDDIRGVMDHYGDRTEGNDTTPTAWALGTLPPSPGGPYAPVTIQNLAIEGAGVTDIFAVNLRAHSLLTASATPVGTNYLEGPQVSPEVNTLTNAAAIHDLRLTLLDRDGAAVLAQVNIGGLGNAESVSSFPMPSNPGQYFLAVDSVTTTDPVQRYQLSVSPAPGSALPWLEATGNYTVSDDLPGASNDGVIQPGESNVNLALEIRNQGYGVASGVAATIAAVSPTVTVVQGASAYPDLSADNASTNALYYRISINPSHQCGEPVLLQLTATCAQDSARASIVSIPTGQVTPTSATLPAIAVPVPITSNQTTVSNLTVPDLGFVTGVRVLGLTGTHTWTGDVTMRLRSPVGTDVVLFQQRGGSGDNFSIINFDDSAALPIGSASPPFTGTWRPEQSFAALLGQPSVGDWQLRLTDSFAGDDGQITAWTLELTCGGTDCSGFVPTAAGDWNLYE